MLKKRILSLLLVLAMTVGMFPVVASAETTTDGPAIQSVQLVLNSVLGIKLKVALPDNDPANYTVKVQIGDSAVQNLPGSADNKEGSLYLYTARMMAHQMTDDIKISMVKGSETVIPETTWHVKSGYVDQLANKGAPEAAKLAGSMWNYGQYAAAYREAEISNAYTDPAVDAVMNAPMVDASHKLTVTQSGSVGASALLYLDEACDIVFKFSAAALEGKTLWVDDTQVETTDAGDGKVQYRIPDILPQDYATKHNVQVKAGDTVAFAMEYSVLSYIYQRQNKTYTGGKPHKDVWVDNLLASMNLYGQDAQSYKAYLAGVIQLTEANAGTPALFAETINKNTAGHYVLAEDLDWNNAAFGITSTDSSSASVIKKFTGVLDGQGHTISNFRLGHSGDNYDSAMILENAGTIRNIGFNFTMATANSSNYGLIQTNSGLIENLFVDVSYAAFQWTTGAVAAVNNGTGTVQNCITVVSTTLTDQAQKNRLGAIVGVDYNGKILNCYSVNTANSVATPYVDTWGNGTYTGSAVYASAQALLDESAENVTADNGWSGYWRVIPGAETAGGIAFGSDIVIAGMVKEPCKHEDKAPVDDVCDLCQESVTLRDTANTVLVNMTNASTPAAFKTLINANLGKTFYLTQDLDWSGVTTQYQGVQTFSGTFDGQGYSIKNFGLAESDPGDGNWSSFLFGTNNGIIRNTGFDYSLPEAKGDSNALVWTNSGTLENLFVKAAFAGAGGKNAAVVYINASTGTVQNCIVDVSSTAASNSENIGPVVYAERSGTVKNCYVVNTANNVTTAYLPVASFDTGNRVGNAVYATAQALLDGSAENVTAENGWSGYWTVAEGGINFNGKVVVAGTYTPPAPPCDHSGDTNPCDDKCDQCDAAIEPAHPNANGDCVCDKCEASLHVDADNNCACDKCEATLHVDENNDCACDKCQASLHVDANKDGLCDNCGEFSGHPGNGEYYINTKTAATLADFVTLINGDLDGKFYVTEDLDYTGSAENTTGIGAFAGILDGQGHTIKGIKIKYNSNHDYESNLFKSNAGTIQNIALDYSIVAANGNITGLVGTNTGVVQNIYAKVTMTADACARAYGNQSPFVAINDGATAAIKNCIVDVTVDASVTTFPETYGVVASRNASSATIDKCYYKITGTAFPSVAYPWSSQTVTELNANATVNTADGWSDVWKKDDTGLYFGQTLILAGAPKCDHVDASPVDGKCDLCGEAVALPEGTYLINNTTAATAADFATLINADLDGNYYVTEDLTYSGQVSISDFAGTLDGQGHTISGITVGMNSTGSWTGNMINTNSGTIQNIGLEYTITATNNNENGLVGTNKGTIQNVYAKASVQAVKDQYGTNSALVGINDGDSAAVIQNCIVDVIVDASITSFPDTYGAVVSRNASGATVDKCYYRVTGATMPGIAYPWSTTNDAKALDSSVTTLPASAGWSGYWKANAAGIWFGGKQVLDTGIGLAEEAIAVYSSYKAEGMTGETGEKPLAWFGSSEDDRANIFAWYDFQKLYQEITGEAIDVVFVDSVSELDENKTYFVLGDDLAKGAGLNTDGITTDNGHKIVKSGDDVYLYGKSGYGTANAMYAFLKQAFKAEFYSDTVYTTTGNTFSLDSITNDTFNPAVDYNWAYDGLLYTNNGKAINYAYQMRMGFVNYWHILGGSHHAFSDLFAEGNYSVDIDLNAGGAIGPNSTYVQTVADYIYEKAKETGRPVIAVGHQDTHDWSTSSESKANLNTYGANSGEYLLFMNEVIKLLNTAEKYADIPAVDVSMLVYNGSLQAPTQNLDALKPNQVSGKVKLRVMFAPIEMNVNGDPDDSTIKDYYGNTPSYYYGEYAKWQGIFGADKVDFWRYSTIFNDFLVPVNTVKYIQENYQAIGSVKHMMDQGTGLSPVQTNYQALLVYLKGQLGKNPEADLDTLITKFCNAYYGAGGTYIKQLLTAQQSHLTTLSTTMNNTSTGFLGTGKKADISGCHNVPASSGGWLSSTNDLYKDKWWSSNCSDDNGTMLKTWYGYITSALAAEGLTTEQKARIQVEAIALRYISLKAHSVALVSGDSLAQVESDAIALGITRYSESTEIGGLA